MASSAAQKRMSVITKCFRLNKLNAKVINLISLDISGSLMYGNSMSGRLKLSGTVSSRLLEKSNAAVLSMASSVIFEVTKAIARPKHVKAIKVEGLNIVGKHLHRFKRREAHGIQFRNTIA